MSDFKSSNTSKFRASGNLISGWTTIPNNIMNDIPNMGSDAFMVFAKILQYISNPEHKISVQGLSTQTGLTTGRVSKGLNKLIDIGYIVRNAIKEGNLTRGYEYIVYDSPQIRESIENARGIENRDSDISDSEFRDANNKNNKNKNNKNKNIDDDDAAKLIELYKNFKLEKRVMPHTTKFLKANNHISLEVYEQIFIDACEDSVAKKFKYIKTIVEDLNSKNVITLTDFEKYNEEFKKTKTKSNSKGSSSSKNRFHNFNQSLDNMTEEYVMERLEESQAKKYGEKQVKKKDTITADVETEDTDFKKKYYIDAINSNWEGIGRGTYTMAKKYAVEYNKPYKVVNEYE